MRDREYSGRGAPMLPTEARDEKLKVVLKLVASGEWYGTATAVELAAEWGMEVSTLMRYRTEAIRMVRMLSDEDTREEVRAILAERCDRIYRVAMDQSFVLDARGEEHPAADTRAATAAVRLHANLYGLMSRTVNLNLGELADKYSAMSDDELNRTWLELQAEEKDEGKVH